SSRLDVVAPGIIRARFHQAMTDDAKEAIQCTVSRSRARELRRGGRFRHTESSVMDAATSRWVPGGSGAAQGGGRVPGQRVAGAAYGRDLNQRPCPLLRASTILRLPLCHRAVAVPPDRRPPATSLLRRLDN